jgi:hypothetical protein
MLVLADAAEVGTAEIPEQFNPSLSVLARETGLNESTVKRHLSELERLGWVHRARPEPEAARLRAERTRYRLLVPEGADVPLTRAPSAPSWAQTEPSQGAEKAHPGRTQRPNKEDSRSSPDPSDQDRPHSGSKAQRGTRIPDDFTVTSDMRAWAMANVPQLAGSRETEKFVNHWRSKSGRDAVKVSWELTWRNWMLRAAEYAAPNGRASPNGHTPYKNPTDPTAYTEGL